MKTTVFYDMSSGGSQKEDFTSLIIKANEATASLVFQHRYGHNPYRVSCTCCGADYSVTEFDTLEEAQELYPDALVADEVQPEETVGELREEGYVWK